MRRQKLYDEIIEEYKKNIKINTFFNENGQDIQNVMKEIILSNCNPINRKKLEF